MDLGHREGPTAVALRMPLWGLRLSRSQSAGSSWVEVRSTVLGTPFQTPQDPAVRSTPCHSAVARTNVTLIHPLAPRP